MKGLSKMRSMIATLLLFAVMAFTLPLSVSAKSPPGQAIHKQTLQKIDLQKNIVTIDTPAAEVSAVLKPSSTASVMTKTATYNSQDIWRLLIRDERHGPQSRHEQTKYSLPVGGFGLRPVLLL